MQLIGGPLDGKPYNSECKQGQRYIVFELSTDDPQTPSGLLAMYEFRDGKWFYLQTRTVADVVAERKAIHDNPNRTS